MLPCEVEVLTPTAAAKPLGSKPDVNNNANTATAGGRAVEDADEGGDVDVEELLAYTYKARKFSACRAPQPALLLRRRRGSDEVDDDEYLHSAHGCANCSDLFPTRSELLLHRLVAHRPQPYQCPECAATFAQPDLLDDHARTHTPDRPNACSHPGCGRRFSLKAHVRSHTRAAHPPPRESLAPAEFRCGSCLNKVFQSAATLANHQSRVHQQRTSLDERPFVCNVCRSAFKHRSNLTRHAKKCHSQ